jgi:hypothetical protein
MYSAAILLRNGCLVGITVTQSDGSRKAFDDFVEQITNAVAMLGADFDNRVEPQAVNLERTRLCAPVVCLVHSEQHRNAGGARSRGDVLVTWDQAFSAVDDKHDDVGAGKRSPPALEHELVKRVCRRTEHAAGVRQFESEVLPHDGMRQHVTGRPWDGGHNRPARASQAIEEGGLANVGPANQDHRG